MNALPSDAAAASSPAVSVTAPSRAHRIQDEETLFRKLVKDHQQRLYRFVVKHIGWGTDAEDITQQAFVEAAHSFATLKGESELSTWLYGGGADGWVEVRAEVKGAAVEVVLRDWAAPFDPTRAPPPDRSTSLDQRRIGGLGLYFVQRLADRLTYRRSKTGDGAGVNELRFTKYFAHPAR